MKTTFLISRYYSETTPESAEHGEYSDTGTIYDAEEMTADELEREIRTGCFYPEDGAHWLSTGHYVESYETGTEREETLHFHRDNPRRLRKHFDRIAQIARA